MSSELPLKKNITGKANGNGKKQPYSPSIPSTQPTSPSIPNSYVISPTQMNTDLYLNSDIDFDTAYMLMTGEQSLPVQKQAQPQTPKMVQAQLTDRPQTQTPPFYSQLSFSPMQPQSPQFPYINQLFEYYPNANTNTNTNANLASSLGPNSNINANIDANKNTIIGQKMQSQSPKTNQIRLQTPLNEISLPIIEPPISPSTKHLLSQFNNLGYSTFSNQLAHDISSTTNSSTDSNGLGVNFVTPSVIPPPLPPISVSSPGTKFGFQMDLLSNTEASALENFLDSIVNDSSSIKVQSTLYGDDKSKLKQEENFGSNNDVGSDNDNNKFSNAHNDSNFHNLNDSSVNDDNDDYINSRRNSNSKKQLLSEQEKKLNHTFSEQKRRAMIKNSFDKLSELVKTSGFELVDDINKEETMETRRKRRRIKSKRKNLSKFDVLSRSVKEIEFLKEMNKELLQLVGSL